MYIIINDVVANLFDIVLYVT